jgi:hypothetical protein
LRVPALARSDNPGSEPARWLKQEREIELVFAGKKKEERGFLDGEVELMVAERKRWVMDKKPVELVFARKRSAG